MWKCSHYRPPGAGYVGVVESCSKPGSSDSRLFEPCKAEGIKDLKAVQGECYWMY
jgi:hypothetical protein